LGQGGTTRFYAPRGGFRANFELQAAYETLPPPVLASLAALFSPFLAADWAFDNPARRTAARQLESCGPLPPAARRKRKEHRLAVRLERPSPTGLSVEERLAR